MPLRSDERRVVGGLHHAGTQWIGILIGPASCLRVVRGLPERHEIDFSTEILWRQVAVDLGGDAGRCGEG